MTNLYPLKFKPIIKDKIWGGSKLREILHKAAASDKAGESWEISGVQGDISIVSNGFLAGNNLQELIEIYMGDLVGNKVYHKYGLEFPILIKFIDASDNLSVQVHPNDDVAAERHNSFGKTEMWYIMQSDPGSELIVGFNQVVDKDKYLNYLKENRLLELMNYEPVSEGDVLFLPAGRIHAINKGILLAEIQQTSDITYRIYDYNRTDDKGKYRDLHTDEAVDVIDYSFYKDYKTNYDKTENRASEIIKCQYFTTNLLEIDQPCEKDINTIDSFVIYMCLNGKINIEYQEKHESLEKGESILIPAELENYKLIPQPEAKLLEVYID